MSKRVLITGGAGFIGSHVADDLLRKGYGVRALDALVPQTHGADAGRPSYLDSEVELIRGDIRNRDSLHEALKGIDSVIHLAALVGVGQSMYEIARYMEVNSYGTGVLLEALVERPVERLVVASSMSIYGEGLYRDNGGRLYGECNRTLDDLRRHQWELIGEHGEPLEPIPTPETKTPCLASVYALSKYDQEQLCLRVGAAYKIPTVALRFFNVYGTRQALSNPYTGVLAIFASRYLNGKPPLINEDGRQLRDFVSVRDVSQACVLALEAPGELSDVFNIGGGRACSVREIACRMGEVLGKSAIAPEITGNYRVGDIRHCFADISKARAQLGYEPQVRLEEGLTELAEWLEGQSAEDLVSKARMELAERGLSL